MPRRRADGTVFAPVVGSRPADEISTQIRDRILRQELGVGDRLPSERELAKQFAVSRNSVRQALRSLADGGLLEIRKGAAGGAFIAGRGGDAVLSAFTDLLHLGQIRLADLTEVRLIIGVEVAKLACLRATDSEIAELEVNVEYAAAYDGSADPEGWMQVQLEFHRILARMSHNPILMTLTSAITELTIPLIRKIGPSTTAAIMPLRRAMLRHLRSKDADAAAAAMRAHLLRLQREYLKRQDRSKEAESKTTAAVAKGEAVCRRRSRRSLSESQ
jgi:GntR family transcriptional regulator, transcriptional repressor for pyruvate dehydrogenase complex